jgi:hypothetical protein
MTQDSHEPDDIAGIEVTPEMIEAGAVVLSFYAVRIDQTVSPRMAREICAEILSSALALRSRAGCE